MFWGSVKGFGVRASYCSIRTLYGFFAGIKNRALCGNRAGLVGLHKTLDESLIILALQGFTRPL